MADVGKTIVYPKPGVTLYLPGGVHGFTGDQVGVPMRSDHAAALVAAGHLVTAEQRKAALDAAAPAEAGAPADTTKAA